MAQTNTRKTLRLGPLAIFFSNQNRQLNIPLHTHYAKVCLEYAFNGTGGFPVLATTMEEVKKRLDSLVEAPFLDTRNEEILEVIFRGFEEWTCPAIESYPGDWKLCAVVFTVFGTRDQLGHADGPATYRMELS